MSYQQVEALVGIYAGLNVRTPLPPARRTAAAPDFLYALAREVSDLRPPTVVELGGGVSTLVCGYALRAVGAGKVYSLEHDEGYAEVTRQNVERHGLAEHVEVIHAPLIPYTINDASYRWYDLSQLAAEQIEFLIIDGPPIVVNDLARFPALPELFERLSPGAAVLLDDASRRDEQEAIRRWTRDFEFASTRMLPVDKGAWLARLPG